MNGIFVTGTDTGIGKTFFTLACIHVLQDAGIRTTAMKPVASGAERIKDELRNDDALQIQRALEHKTAYSLINPYCFEPAVSPHIAAAEAGVTIDTEVIKQRYDQLCREADYMIVEGVGGWLAPLTNQLSVADLAKTIGLPVVMVVGIRLGCLNHAMLTAEAIRQKDLQFGGWVANCIEPDMNAQSEQIDYLGAALGMPPLATLSWQAPTGIALQNLPGLDSL